MAERHRKNRADRHDPAAKQVLVRFPAEVGERLVAEAQARDVPVAWIVRHLVSDGLERLVPVADMLTTRRPVAPGASRNEDNEG